MFNIIFIKYIVIPQDSWSSPSLIHCLEMIPPSCSKAS